MSELRLEIPLVPVGKARARTYTRKDGKTQTVTPKKTRDFERLAAMHVKAQMAQVGWTTEPGPVVVSIAIHRYGLLVDVSRFDRKRHGRFDGDNIEKAVLDALQKAGVYCNDSQVTACTWAFEEE